MFGWIGLILVAACGAAVIGYGVPAEYLGLHAEGASDVVRIAAMVLTICAALFIAFMENVGLALRQASIWLAIFLGIASMFTYRAELIEVGQEVAGDYIPEDLFAQDNQTAELENNRRIVAIRAAESGHFDVDTLINGTHVSMLADTGATLVTLTSEDARRIGIDVNALAYDIPLRTANGVTHGASIDIDEIEVGGILVRKVAAIVSQPNALHRSLLGMSYFREIGSFQLSGDQLVLRE